MQVKTKNAVVGVIQKAEKFGVATSRFRISKQDAEQIREAEKISPQAGVLKLLELLRTPRAK